MSKDKEDNNKENETIIGDDSAYDDSDVSLEKFDPYEKYENDGDKIIVPFKFPVVVKGREITEAKIRPPYGADLRVAGGAKNDTDNALILIERCSEGFTKEHVNKMRAPDISNCGEVINFLSEG